MSKKTGHAKLSNDFWRNPKVQRLMMVDKAAGFTYVLVLDYCSDTLSDGFIGQDPMVYSLHATPEELGTLEELGMLEPVDGGWLVHDYLQYQNSREYVEERDEANRARVRQWRESHAKSPSDDSGDTADTGHEQASNESVTHYKHRSNDIETDNQEPKPRTNNQNQEPKSLNAVVCEKTQANARASADTQTTPAKNPTPVPPSFQPDQANQDRMTSLGLTPRQQAWQTRRFKAKNQADGTLKHDWQAVFSLWLDNIPQVPGAGQPADDADTRDGP